MQMNKTVVIIVVMVAIAIVLSQATYIIEEGKQGIVFQFGEPIAIVQYPGLYFKAPFIHDLVVLEKRVLGTAPLTAEYLTLDKKRLSVDHISRWEIVDPLLYYRTVRTEQAAVARLDQVIAGRLREEIARHDFIEIVREKREPIMAVVTEGAQEATSRFGINLLDVRIQRIDLPVEVQSSVFERMQAERKRIANRYRAEGEERALEIRATADKQREIILANAYNRSQVLRGEGDALAAEVTAAAFDQDLEFYSFLRRLEVYEKVLAGGATIVLPPSSELWGYLESPTYRNLGD